MKKAGVIIVLLNLVAVLCVVNGAILKKRHIVENGTTVFLKLRPVDPRSLMQGDYMILRQEILSQNTESAAMSKQPTRGKIVLTLDEKQIGSFSRPDDGSQLQANEVLLKYRRANRGYQFGLESFFFQEGDAKVYEEAKFCEIRVSPNGDAVLVDLRGADLVELKTGTLSDG